MNQLFDLGALADPSSFHQPIDFCDYEPSVLCGFMKAMMRIRKVEQKLAEEKRNGSIRGPVHLGVGQEAVAVGISAALRPSDRVFGAHRSHAHLLALGSDLRRLFAEVLGKDTGLSRGMGGSMHLWDQPRGFYGSVPIVAGTVPLAVGAALAAKMMNTGDVGVAYFGDGAVEEGVVHESLNMAKMLHVPVIFVVENNFFASHMHISLRQPKNMTARFAWANDIPYKIVDGNDVVAVSKAGHELIESARCGGGPGFIEAVTFRWLGHVDWREDIDVGVHRSAAEVAQWRARDPILRLRKSMEQCGWWSEDQHKMLEESIAQEIETEWRKAMDDPYPPSDALLKRVYS